MQAVSKGLLTVLNKIQYAVELFIFEQIAQSEALDTDVNQIHDKTLFGNSRYIKVDLFEQVQNINQQIIIINYAPESYNKEQLDALFLLKVDKTDTYSKPEDDSLQLLKTDKTELIDSYSKQEDDAILLLKANAAELSNYVDLTSAQTITGSKQFKIISGPSISKLSKNEASILLAGGGDMLVSSLIIHSQLQDVRDIAIGKSKAYVFSNLDELNDWMKLVIFGGMELTQKVLYTELPEMSNVISTLGTATGGCNAITEISIDGNTLTSAKKQKFC
ncbi:MAG: hypothetical protein EZS28_000276 [Streblomastix strix]|uniref:Uncharacterized protein n=1 Tax=Streblomastix strix TaxID=222440 RepID=A0A5J4XAR0_9EUKA|nr:MAG: hypothetical protein EZS28_000276 [Streblomastix strix]